MMGHVIAIYGGDVIYHIKEPDPSQVIGSVYELRHAWPMQAFFAMAGWSAMSALGTKGWRTFWRNRARRLGIPLVVGILLLCPIIKYFELKGGLDLRPDGIRAARPLDVNLLEFYGLFYTRSIYATWSHLWFLAYLLIITALVYPILTRLGPWVDRYILMIPRWFRPYWPTIPAAAVLVIGHGWWPYYPNLFGDIPNFLHFATFFLSGALLSASKPFHEAVSKDWWQLGLVGIATLVTMLWFRDTTIGRVLVGIGAWCIVAALYGGLQKINWKRGPTMRYLGDAIMPLFVTHNALAVVGGYYLMQVNMNLWFKLLILLVVVIGGALLFFQIFIRHIWFMRFLFGAPPGTPRARARAAAGAA